jgi:fumarylacetoacetase-like protein
MRLLTYVSATVTVPRIGVRVGHRVLDIEAASRVDGEPLPSTMKALLKEGRGALSRVQALAKAAQTNAGRFSGAMLEERAIRLLAPIVDANPFMEGEVARGKACGPQLVMVIGRRADDVDAEDAMDYVFGVTLLNHLGGENAGALGPEIVTMDEIPHPEDLWLTCTVNGEERVRGNTREELSKLPEALAQRSQAAPLEPGDMVSVIVAKPGARALALKAGDVVECSIEGVATLRTVVAPQ